MLSLCQLQSTNIVADSMTPLQRACGLDVCYSFHATPRVSCSYLSGITVVPNGNPWWLTVLIRNVAGPGSLAKAEVNGRLTH